MYYVLKYFFQPLMLLLVLLSFSCHGGQNERNNGVYKDNYNRKTYISSDTTSLRKHNKVEGDISDNILRNSGFEEGLKFWSKKFNIDNKIKRSGTTSASLIYPKGSRNSLFTQTLEIQDLKSGDIYEFSGWIKGEDISTEDLNTEKGAAIFIQGYNSFGKYIKGEFSVSLTGSFDWQFVKGLYKVPKGVSNLKFGFFLRNQSFGSVWFDDLEVKKLDNSNVKLLNKPISTEKTVYIDEDGFTIKNGKRFFPLILFIGEGPKGGNWASSDDNLKRIAKAGFNSVMSYYYGDRNDIDDFFVATRKHNLNVVFNLKDIHDGLHTYRRVDEPAINRAMNIVSTFKNENNLLAWYINDEMGLGKYSSLESLYSGVRTEDYNHPVYQVEYEVDNFKYLKEFSDIIGTDPYPVDKKNVNSLGLVSDLTRKTVEIAGKEKGIWQVIQLVDLTFAGRKEARAPTFQEMRNMTYQALIGGATGLSFYNYHWLWYDLDSNGKKIFSSTAFNNRWPEIVLLIQEINDITPVILDNNKSSFLIRQGGESVTFQAFIKDEKYYLLFSNLGDSPQKVVLDSGVSLRSFSLPSSVSGVSVNLIDKGIELNLEKFTSGYIILE